MKTILPNQFRAWVALTSIRPGSRTHSALERYLVLGIPKREAIEGAGIKLTALNAALRRLQAAEAAAREFVRTMPAD